eukprot:9334844-Alexandrium_andersonii.AAC.1
MCIRDSHRLDCPPRVGGDRCPSLGGPRRLLSATGPGGVPWGGHALLSLCGLGQRPPGVHSGPRCCRLAGRATASR